jgi:uncharacterized protein YidB (DUF937 family)
MGFLDEVIGAALGAKASPLQNPSPQMAPRQDQFSQSAAALQELLATKQGPVPGGQASAPTAAAQQSSSGLDMLLRQFQQNGLGEIINSWIGPGQSQPISPTQLARPLARTRSTISPSKRVRHKMNCLLCWQNIFQASSTS